MVPLDAMPTWAQTIAPVWPAYWAMQGLWGAADGDARRALMSSAVMTCIAALAATITAVPLARGWGRNTLI